MVMLHPEAVWNSVVSEAIEDRQFFYDSMKVASYDSAMFKVTELFSKIHSTDHNRISEVI